jgi:tetratricopeptide (TPR) repeat protein
MIIKFNIKDLLKNDDLIYLVGAGCSVDGPSCLPVGHRMMEEIIKFACIKTEKDKLLELMRSGQLRFEALVELVRDVLDPELKVIDYYGLCDKPNLQHIFLTEMIEKGHFVVTTNFDFLIEYAMLHYGMSKDNIKIIITQGDFKENENPNELLKQGIKALYKIHGSTKNIITEEDTRESLIATIQAFGSNKEGLSVFQVEPFKQPFFNNISKNRSLVIMGYSGSDDFDIVPTLKLLKDLKKVIWLNYIVDDKQQEHIFKIYKKAGARSDVNDKTTKILNEIRNETGIEETYRVDANTTRIVESLLEKRFEVSSTNFILNPQDWFKEKLIQPTEYIKYYITSQILFDYGLIKDALRCDKIGFKLADEKNDPIWTSKILNHLGIIYKVLGKFPEAIKQYNLGIKIADRLNNSYEKAQHLTELGRIYEMLGKFSEALEAHEKALKVVKEMGDLRDIAKLLGNIGRIYFEQSHYDKAIKKYEEAISINEKTGDMLQKAFRLNNIAKIHFIKGRYSEALTMWKEALPIAKQLGKKSAVATHLVGIGRIYEIQGDLDEALNCFEKALNIDNEIGKLVGKGRDLDNIGNIYKSNGQFNEALEKYNEALYIDKNLEELGAQAIVLNHIGELYIKQGNISIALEKLKEALKLEEKLERKTEKAILFNNLSEIYIIQRKFSKALDYSRKALRIIEQVQSLPYKAIILSKFGKIYNFKGKEKKSIKYYEEVLRIYSQLGLESSPAALIVKNGMENLEKG